MFAQHLSYVRVRIHVGIWRCLFLKACFCWNGACRPHKVGPANWEASLLKFLDLFPLIRSTLSTCRRPSPTPALYERAREATRMEEDSDEDSAGAAAPWRVPLDRSGQQAGSSGSRYQRPLR